MEELEVDMRGQRGEDVASWRDGGRVVIGKSRSFNGEDEDGDDGGILGAIIRRRKEDIMTMGRGGEKGKKKSRGE